jgi:hypothetical protein
MQRVVPPAVRRLTLAIGAFVAAGCSVPNRADLEVMQSVNDLSAEVNALRQDYGAMLDQVDSLRLLVAKHDSVVRTLANLAGVTVPSTQ